MDDKNKKTQDAKQKQWEDKVDIAAAKIKLAGHKAEEKWNEFSEDAKSAAKHASDVAKEKATEAKNTLDETIQKVQYRLDETFNK